MKTKTSVIEINTTTTNELKRQLTAAVAELDFGRLSAQIASDPAARETAALSPEVVAAVLLHAPDELMCGIIAQIRSSRSHQTTQMQPSELKQAMLALTRSPGFDPGDNAEVLKRVLTLAQAIPQLLDVAKCIVLRIVSITGDTTRSRCSRRHLANRAAGELIACNQTHLLRAYLTALYRYAPEAIFSSLSWLADHPVYHRLFRDILDAPHVPWERRVAAGHAHNAIPQSSPEPLDEPEEGQCRS